MYFRKTANSSVKDELAGKRNPKLGRQENSLSGKWSRPGLRQQCPGQMNRRCPIVRWWCLLRIMNGVFVLETKWVPSAKMVLQTEELFSWEERLWTVGVCIGCLGEWYLWSFAELKGFQPTRGPCSILARDYGTFEFCLIIPYSLRAKRNCAIFGAHLNYLRQPGKTQFPH